MIFHFKSINYKYTLCDELASNNFMPINYILNSNLEYNFLPGETLCTKCIQILICKSKIAIKHFKNKNNDM